jgi:hypothetical protein
MVPVGVKKKKIQKKSELGFSMLFQLALCTFSIL